MRRSKYPNFGILDALSRFALGFSTDPTRQGLYEFLGPQKPPPIKYSKVLYSLEDMGYIRKKGSKISLTAKGEDKLRHHNLIDMKLSKISDGVFRIIAFDIPEKMRYARNIMRSKLKAFECVKIQKSLYMTPYVCEKEIAEISDMLKITRYVTVLKIYPVSLKKDDRLK